MSRKRRPARKPARPRGGEAGAAVSWEPTEKVTERMEHGRRPELALPREAAWGRSPRLGPSDGLGPRDGEGLDTGGVLRAAGVTPGEDAEEYGERWGAQIAAGDVTREEAEAHLLGLGRTRGLLDRVVKALGEDDRPVDTVDGPVPAHEVRAERVMTTAPDDGVGLAVPGMDASPGWEGMTPAGPEITDDGGGVGSGMDWDGMPGGLDDGSALPEGWEDTGELASGLTAPRIHDPETWTRNLSGADVSVNIHGRVAYLRVLGEATAHAGDDEAAWDAMMGKREELLDLWAADHPSTADMADGFSNDMLSGLNAMAAMDGSCCFPLRYAAEWHRDNTDWFNHRVRDAEEGFRAHLQLAAEMERDRNLDRLREFAAVWYGIRRDERGPGDLARASEALAADIGRALRAGQHLTVDASVRDLLIEAADAATNEPLRLDQLPAPVGVVVLGRPVLYMTMGVIPCPVRVIAWQARPVHRRPYGQPNELEVAFDPPGVTTPDGERWLEDVGVGVWLFGDEGWALDDTRTTEDIGDDDDMVLSTPWWAPPGPVLIDQFGWAPGRWAEPGYQPPGEELPLVAHHVAFVRRFLTALWEFLNDELVVVTKARPSRPLRRRADRLDMAELETARLVRFRQTRYLRAGEEGPRDAEGVEWRHRWLVRGHRRRLKSGKVTWVRGYIKPQGPQYEDLPLIIKRQVWIADR